MQVQQTHTGNAQLGIAIGVIVIGALLYSNAFPHSQTLVGSMTTASLSTPIGFPRPVSSSEETRADSAELQTLRRKVDLLAQGRDHLTSMPGYTAQFTRQEMVDGELLEESTMFLKCRNRPFSVYLLWLTTDEGREVLYVDGENQGKLLVHEGGWKSRFPSLSINSQSNLAMSSSRYPVTKAGLAGLIDIMTDVHQRDLESNSVAACEHREGVEFAGRPCHEFVTHYRNAQGSPIYRKSVTLIDQEWNLPVSSRHYEWGAEQDGNAAAEDTAALDADTLIESYQFTELQFDQQFSAAEFDPEHPEYRFN